MTLEQVFEQLTPIFRDVFDDEEIELSETMTAKDVDEWDSLNHIRLIVSVEGAFKIKFATGEVSSFKNVGHFAETILGKVQANG